MSQNIFKIAPNISKDNSILKTNQVLISTFNVYYNLLYKKFS